MKINNKQADAHESNITLVEFGNAMKQLNLDDVPDHRRAEAIQDHLMRIMADSIRDKEVAEQLHISRILNANG